MRTGCLPLGLLCRPALSFLVNPTQLSGDSSCFPGSHQQKPPALDVSRSPADEPPIVGRTDPTMLAAGGSPAFLSDSAVSCYRSIGTGSTVYLVGVIHDSRRSSKVSVISIHGAPF